MFKLNVLKLYTEQLELNYNSAGSKNAFSSANKCPSVK